jgi:beta-aspartyl-dipeptidase (metallo-type)
MELLLRKGHVFTPQYAGVADVLIENGVITCIRENIRVSAFVGAREIDAAGCFVMPGFIDTHVHIASGGDNGGSGPETPENALALLKRGITGCLLVQGFERMKKTPRTLYELAELLEKEGVEALALAGSGQIPITAVYRSVAEEMEMIGSCRGTGEIALFDSRAPGISLEDIVLLLQTVHKAMKRTEKPIKAVFHIGDQAEDLSLFFRMAKVYEHALYIAVPAPVNRNEGVLKDAAEYVKAGGFVDIASGVSPEERDKGMIPAPEALKYIFERTGSLKNTALSSGAGGPVPEYDEKGAIKGCGTARTSLLHADLQAAYRSGLKLSELLQAVSAGPMEAYGFGGGCIAEGAPARINITDDDLNLKYTIAGNRII